MEAARGDSWGPAGGLILHPLSSNPGRAGFGVAGIQQALLSGLLT